MAWRPQFADPCPKLFSRYGLVSSSHNLRAWYCFHHSVFSSEPGFLTRAARAKTQFTGQRGLYFVHPSWTSTFGRVQRDHQPGQPRPAAPDGGSPPRSVPPQPRLNIKHRRRHCWNPAHTVKGQMQRPPPNPAPDEVREPRPLSLALSPHREPL